MKITKQVVMAILSILLGAMIIGGGTYAYFSSQAVSSNNTFTAGIIDITAGGSGSILTPFNVSHIKPGTSNAIEQTYTIKNTRGTLAADISLKLNYDITDADSTSEGELDKDIIIKTLTYGSINLLTAKKSDNPEIDLFNKAADGDSASLSLYDLKQATSSSSIKIGEVSAGDTGKDFVIKADFIDDGDQNDLQGDHIDNAAFTFDALQK